MFNLNLENTYIVEKDLISSGNFFLFRCDKEHMYTSASILTCPVLSQNPNDSLSCLPVSPQPFRHLKLKVRFFLFFKDDLCLLGQVVH